MHLIDWLLIGVYLAFALGVGIYMRRTAGRDRESYFLAGRSLPWWWCGASIAATTFAADTPLAVTGIIADRGLSGNWIWLSWMGVHAAAVVIFASRWNRTGVLTDAEFIQLRYSGKAAGFLRLFRAGLYGFVFNCIVLGWVMRAMVKITQPFFHWEEWFPGFMAWFSAVWPTNAALGAPSEGLTILILLALVGIYATLGGLRGVILTDLVQLALALFGSFWLAFAAWNAIGGQPGLVASLAELYGTDHQFLNLFPRTEGGWLDAVGIGAFGFGFYLFVQSYSNMPADGGGFFMQRLNAAQSPLDARRASLLFIVLQYVIRAWPWFIVGLAALVLIPLGLEEAAHEAGSSVAADREMAYPVLMGELLGPGILGILITSLLAAFMSTIDTHINWGASYVVNDIFLKAKPDASDRLQIIVARSAVAGFAVLAVLVSFQIETIEQAWRWVATLGAALGIPTALRWLWWRVNAMAEIGAMIAGLSTALFLLAAGNVAYEVSLIIIAAASAAGMLVGMWIGSNTEEKISSFVAVAEPRGIWPGRPVTTGLRHLAVDALRIAGIVVGCIGLLLAIQQGTLFGRWGLALIIAALAAGLMIAGYGPGRMRKASS